MTGEGGKSNTTKVKLTLLDEHLTLNLNGVQVHFLSQTSRRWHSKCLHLFHLPFCLTLVPHLLPFTSHLSFRCTHMLHFIFTYIEFLYMSCEICQTKNETVLKQLENYATARRLGTFSFCTAKLHNRPSLL